MTTKEPRLVWIEFNGDPSDDKEVYKRYSATKPFKPCGLDAEVVALVEASALTEALSTISNLRAACTQLTEENEGLKLVITALHGELGYPIPSRVELPPIPEKNLIAEFVCRERDEARAEVERLSLLIKIADELITNENARKDWEDVKRTRHM